MTDEELTAIEKRQEMYRKRLIGQVVDDMDALLAEVKRLRENNETMKNCFSLTGEEARKRLDEIENKE